MQENIHGGNLQRIGDKYKIDKNKIIDFSSNINPLGMNSTIKKTVKESLKIIKSYPDPNNTVLTKALSDYYGIDKKNILPGNGSSQLIYLLPKILKIKKALIIRPNFAEYELSLNTLNIKIKDINNDNNGTFKTPVESIRKHIKDADILYLSNPNNPAGYIYNKDELLFLAKECENENTYLFIDEAFIDFVINREELKMINQLNKFKNLIILNSFTKTLAIPGLRLGMLSADEEIIENLKKIMPPWSINSIAQNIGAKIESYKDFINKSAIYINKEKDYLYNNLNLIKNISFYESYANYILCRLNKRSLQELENHLGKNRIAIRNCSNYKGLDNKHFRIAVKRRRENSKLIKYLKDFFK